MMDLNDIRNETNQRIYKETLNFNELAYFDKICELQCLDSEMKNFKEKLISNHIKEILISQRFFWLMDDNLCDCDHAIFCFEDNEKYLLSSRMINEEEWDFYAFKIEDNYYINEKYHSILPTDDPIKYVSLYSLEEIPTSHYLDLSLDDAYLRIHADEYNLVVGVVNPDDNFDWKKRKRKTIFIDK